MADNSTSPTEPLDFHPCNTPRGMTYYKLQELNEYQQNQLSAQKLEVLRENQKYLKEHPEIRTVVDILMGAILRARPKVKLRIFLAKYFMENYDDIKAILEQFSTDCKEEQEPIEEFNFQTEEQEDLRSLSEESASTSLMCVISNSSPFDDYPKMVLDKQIVNKDEEYSVSQEIVDDIVKGESKDESVPQVPQILGNNSDSDPMLSFETYFSDEDFRPNRY